jgi:hypothetical protein
MGKFMRIALMAAACGLALAGCASDPEPDPDWTAYVSPESTCADLAVQAEDVSERVAKATGRDYKGDAIAADVGRVVFFPILVFREGNYVSRKELARLNRSMKAIEQASIQKNCGITFQHGPQPPPNSPG